MSIAIMPLPATPSQDLIAAHCANLIADLLYKADKGDLSAALDQPPAVHHELRAHYQQIAEAAVRMVCDEDLRDAADYYAVAVIVGEAAIELATLPLAKRINLVREFRCGMNAYLRFLRNFYPTAVQQYKDLAKADRAQMIARKTDSQPLGGKAAR